MVTARVLAIDPGNEQSAWALIDTRTCRPLEIGKADNTQVRVLLQVAAYDCQATVAIEMISSYGMAVGATVFDTVRWIGRFEEICEAAGPGCELRYRADVKLHHCCSMKANDSNITQALIDRFARGLPNRGKGTKKAPGWFYGFHRDVWQAYALAVMVADELEGRPPAG